MKHLRFAFLKHSIPFLSVSFLLLSCSTAKICLPDYNEDEDVTELRLLIPESICAFDPDAFFGEKDPVKSDSGGQVIVSGDEMAYDRAVTVEKENRTYTQIPVVAEGMLDSTIVRFTDVERGDSPLSSPGKAKTFLVCQRDLDGMNPVVNILTMVPQPKYMEKNDLEDFDLFNLSGFNGLIFYARTDGSIILVHSIINGELHSEGGVDNQRSDAASVSAVLGFPKRENDSTSAMKKTTGYGSYHGGTLDPAVVIVERKPPGGAYDEEPEPDMPEVTEKTTDDNIRFITDHPFSGGGGSSEKAEVRIKIVGKGSATGGGYHSINNRITCEAVPACSGIHPLSEFIGWSGHVVSTKPSVTFEITDRERRVYDLTATFHDLLPCSSENKADPLMKMKILGSKNNGINGGRYGMGRQQRHLGIDLECPIGTPVFSTISGTVTCIRTGFLNNETWEEYTKRGGTSKKKSFNAGNAVYVTGRMGGQLYAAVFFHLQEVFVSLNDSVSMGEIIGLSGNTGNASSSGCAGPHLHFEIWENADHTKKVNPELFLHTDFNEKGEQTNPCKQP